jgi:DNA helicase II / ATP-dependent DNA helicase PcrA
MMLYTDLHIHSKYSRATSPISDLEHNFIWACKKGIDVVGTGDFTFPAWFNELKEKLIPVGNGLYKLKPAIEEEILKLVPNSCRKSVSFMLTSEISTIYKKGIKTRKIHHLFHFPKLEEVAKFNAVLDKIGNIRSDGRPILGLDSIRLFEKALDSSPSGFLIPAHIWTPWFSVLGSKSGFDSIEECYEDLSSEIFAVETGLSSDPEMNWKISSLDKFRLVSNSDCHSPSKIAREATVFDTEADFYKIKNALKNGDGYVGTVEFFPEEGKYHMDGHRKCGFCCKPSETLKNLGRCPKCGGIITVGVEHRINQLADKIDKKSIKPATGGKVYSLIPLEEIISEIIGVGKTSQKAQSFYEKMINELGNELNILKNIDVNSIEKIGGDLIKEAILRLRSGKVIKQAGYDGEYGNIRLFTDEELGRRPKVKKVIKKKSMKKEGELF